MKTVLFRQHGGTEVLEYSDFPLPQPAEGEVLVRLKVAALNRLDLWVRNGWPGIRLDYPHIPGADGAGVVVQAGPGRSIYKPGDRVVINPNLSCGNCPACQQGMDNRCRDWELLGETRRGTYAEYIALQDRNLYPIPDGFDEAKAAAAALVYQTAWHSLISVGRLQAGETVLIVGASGGVNIASIQIAKLAGATVYVIGSGPEKMALAQASGADVVIDRSQDENWAKKIFSITDKRGVDIVVDNVGTTFPQSFRAAAKGGRILTVGNTGGAKIEIDNRFIFGKHLSVLGSTMSPRHDFTTVMDLIFQGRLTPIIGANFPLKEARPAQQLLESGKQMGKILLWME